MTQRELLERLPSSGPEWDAAIAYGIDVTLLTENLALTPTERLEQLAAMNELYEELFPDDDLEGP
jgi:hypothetical protein